MTEAGPDTVVLIHGLWMTPRSWENWIPYFEAKGLNVVAPGYPGFEVEVDDLRATPEVIANLTIPETVEHLATVIAALDKRPIIMGHSFGGTLTQLLLAQGLGAAGVAINSAPTQGVRVNPPSQVRSLFPVFRNPSNARRAVAFKPKEFHYAFPNTLTAEESEEIWSRYAIAAPGRWVWVHGLVDNLKPGRGPAWVDYAADRAPLLFIGGSEDHIMPPAVNKKNAKRYRESAGVTEYYEFEGRDHWTCGAPGWEAVADHALDWALTQAR
jgi:pimeloyl-ACP methyl ester carboxylesterase